MDAGAQLMLLVFFLSSSCMCVHVLCVLAYVWVYRHGALRLMLGIILLFIEAEALSQISSSQIRLLSVGRLL